MFQSLISGFFGDGVEIGTVEVNGVQVEGAEAAQSVLEKFAGFGVVIGVVLLGLGVLGIFMARGAFKGQKWSPIVSIVFAALAIAVILTSFSNSQLFSLALNAFTLYVAVMCVKHPYFNQAK